MPAGCRRGPVLLAAPLDCCTIPVNTPVVQQLPNTTLLKYGAADTYTVMDQVVSVINKHNGGLDRIFCAQLAVGFHWSAQ